MFKGACVLVFVAMSLSFVGCGGVGGSGERRKAGYATSAAEIYALGQVLGAQDAVEGFPSDYARHLKSLDSEFIAQFRLGYDKGYTMYQP
jgi:hypothetical protein